MSFKDYSAVLALQLLIRAMLCVGVLNFCRNNFLAKFTLKLIFTGGYMNIQLMFYYIIIAVFTLFY